MIATIPTLLSAYIEPEVIVYENVREEVEEVVLIESQVDWTTERIEEEIRKVFWEEPDLAVQIAKCESNLVPEAINTNNLNGSIDRGLMQINSIHDTTGYDLFDVQDNLMFARKLYDEKRYKPWVCARMI